MLKKKKSRYHMMNFNMIWLKILTPNCHESETIFCFYCLVTSCFILNTKLSLSFQKTCPSSRASCLRVPDHLKCFHLIPLDPHVYIVCVLPCLVASTRL